MIDSVKTHLGIRSEIERVMYRHKETIAHPRDDRSFWQVGCACGWKPPYLNADWSDAMVVYSRHVADVLIEALGLQQDWGNCTGGRHTEDGILPIERWMTRWFER